MQKVIEDYGLIILLAMIVILLFLFFSGTLTPKMKDSAEITDTKKNFKNQNKATIIKPEIQGLTDESDVAIALKAKKGSILYPCKIENFNINWNDANETTGKRRLQIKITKNGSEWKTIDSRDPESTEYIEGNPIATLKDVAIVTDEVGIDNSKNDGTIKKETIEIDDDDKKAGTLHTSSVSDEDQLDSYILEYTATNGKGYYSKRRIKLISY